MTAPKAKLVQGFYNNGMVNGNKGDTTLNKYFTMPETVMRNGKMVNIKEHNSQSKVYKAPKKKKVSDLEFHQLLAEAKKYYA